MLKVNKKDILASSLISSEDVRAEFLIKKIYKDLRLKSQLQELSFEEQDILHSIEVTYNPQGEEDKDIVDSMVDTVYSILGVEKTPKDTKKLQDTFSQIISLNEEKRPSVNNYFELFDDVIESVGRLDYTKEIPYVSQDIPEKDVLNYASAMMNIVVNRVASKTITQHVLEAILDKFDIGGVVVTDLEGRIRYVNKDVEDWIGGQNFEFLNRSVEDVIPGWSLEDVILPNKKIEVVNKKDKEEKVLHVNQLNTKPDNEVSEERVYILTLEKLSLNKFSAIEMVLGQETHDKLAPLNQIVSLAKMLEVPKGNDQQKYLDYLIQTTEKVREDSKVMLESLMKGIPFQLSKIDFEKCIQEQISSLKYSNGLQNVGINYTVSVVSFHSNLKMIQSIIGNLMSNSVRFSRKSLEPQIINIEITEEENYGVVVRVADNGLGISKENLPHIFEKTFTQTPNDDGTGSGLYIVKSYVDNLKGKVSVQSEEGEGTLFNIMLPHLLD